MRTPLTLVACALLSSLLPGCANPNAIGVQDYGTLVGRVYDAQTRQPLNQVIVSVGSLVTGRSGPDGAFTLTRVPSGTQSLTVYGPPSYLSPPPVTVEVENGQTTVVPAIGIAPSS